MIGCEAIVNKSMRLEVIEDTHAECYTKIGRVLTLMGTHYNYTRPTEVTYRFWDLTPV